MTPAKELIFTPTNGGFIHLPLELAGSHIGLLSNHTLNLFLTLKNTLIEYIGKILISPAQKK